MVLGISPSVAETFIEERGNQCPRQFMISKQTSQTQGSLSFIGHDIHIDIDVDNTMASLRNAFLYPLLYSSINSNIALIVSIKTVSNT